MLIDCENTMNHDVRCFTTTIIEVCPTPSSDAYINLFANMLCNKAT